MPATAASAVASIAVLALAVAGCDQGSGAADVDRSDPLVVAEAYAFADHQDDHDALYDLVGAAVLEGRSRQEWVADQRARRERHEPDVGSRYPGDSCHGGTRSPRSVAQLQLRDLGEPDSPLVEPGLYVVRVIIEFDDGDTRQCLYGLRPTPDGAYEIVETAEP